MKLLNTERLYLLRCVKADIRAIENAGKPNIRKLCSMYTLHNKLVKKVK